ncbi:MAG: hypothetical protein IJM64_09175 [Ottowia sp.]|nr:hypothetical protein [Ottowia sp.]
MAYKSIEAVQEALTNGIFSKRKDARKAAGRSLGTLVEIITFYLLRSYGLEDYLAIERSLKEYARPEIGHNVEFTLHGSSLLGTVPYGQEDSISAAKIAKSLGIVTDGYERKSHKPVANRLVKNAATLFESEHSFINAYPCAAEKAIRVSKLTIRPFAMLECKRVGVEKGLSRGPQTIEKAKQGAYVALTASRLQKVRALDGRLFGILEEGAGEFTIKPYSDLLYSIIKGRDYRRLRDVVVTVGVVSNHGNWFTHENQNKEMKVLSESYDWLLFLTDEGLTSFINDMLLGEAAHLTATYRAFQRCYADDASNNDKFTKSSMPMLADIELTKYFSDNLERITGWFNIVAPAGGTVPYLMELLRDLAHIDWAEVYKQ